MIWVGVIIAFLALVFLPAGEHLLLGWLYFPIRVLPRITIDPATATVGVFSFILFTGGLHFVLRRLSAENGSAPVWPWRATVVLTLLVLMLFITGISMVGAAHQIVWIFSSRTTENSEAVFGLTDTARSAAQKMQQSNNLKSIAIGVQNFHDTYQALPPGGTMTDDGELLHGWAIVIAPFTNDYAEGIDFAIPWNCPPNDRFFRCNLPDFINPAIGGPFLTSKASASRILLAMCMSCRSES
jgi:hypothetical protein